MLVIHTDFEQGSQEWHDLRETRVGGSTCAPLFTEPSSKLKDKGHILGKGAMSLAYSLAAKQAKLDQPISYSPYQEVRTFSMAMERGTDLEPFARESYTEETGRKVQEVGYIEDTRFRFVGFSPDGLVGDEGLIEIKCPLGQEFTRVMLTGEIKKDYLCQMHFGMWITGRQWCEMYTYHPENRRQSLIRVERDPQIMARLDIAIPAFNNLVLAGIEALSNGGK